MRRKPLRVQKAYITYEFKGGNAGFIKMWENGKPKQLKNKTLTFTRRRNHA